MIDHKLVLQTEYREHGTGAGKSLERWSPVEKQLALQVSDLTALSKEKDATIQRLIQVLPEVDDLYPNMPMVEKELEAFPMTQPTVTQLAPTLAAYQAEVARLREELAAAQKEARSKYETATHWMNWHDEAKRELAAARQSRKRLVSLIHAHRKFSSGALQQAQLELAAATAREGALREAVKQFHGRFHPLVNGVLVFDDEDGHDLLDAWLTLRDALAAPAPSDAQGEVKA